MRVLESGGRRERRRGALAHSLMANGLDLTAIDCRLTPGKLEIDAALESAAIRAKQALDARMTPLKAHLAKVEQRKMIARTRRQDSMATLPGVSDKLAEIEAEAVVGTASE